MSEIFKKEQRLNYLLRYYGSFHDCWEAGCEKKVQRRKDVFKEKHPRLWRELNRLWRELRGGKFPG